MGSMNTGSWTRRDPDMPSSDENGFQQFFDIGMSHTGDGMPFDFSSFHDMDPASMMQHSHHNEIDTSMSGTNMVSIAAHSSMGVQTQVSAMASASAHAVISSQVQSQQHNASNAILDIDAQIRFLQHQKLEQQQRQIEEERRRLQEEEAAFYAQRRLQQQQQQQQKHNIVPPTPQSLEMQAAGHFYTSHDQVHSTGMFDGYQQMKDSQDMAFTPLVSPAVTPLDAHFSVDNQFMVPSAYFSPITSPALHAQPDSVLFYDAIRSGHTSQSNNSPAGMDTDSPPTTTGPDSALKEARKMNSAKRKPRVRQSPITRPKKKPASTPAMNAQALSELAEVVAEKSDVSRRRECPSFSSEASDNASASPEALEMPPPPLPLPRSARQSPYLTPQTNGECTPALLLRTLEGKPSPATPASLFRISPRNQTVDQDYAENNGAEHIENFELPEAVSSVGGLEAPPLTASQKQSHSSSDVETPRMAPLQPLPSPSRSVSTTQSPQITPLSAASASKKTPVLAPKGGRKRASVSSVSPALLPKISPHIKSLLPGAAGRSTGDSASMLLASKSNYQRILEGNPIPGVTYPSELSKTLTSKRTSHKLAEQGRRNRINSAIDEIRALLPNSATKDPSNEDSDMCVGGDMMDGKQSGTSASKAGTVESAIDYIKHLQKELAEANKRAEEAEKKLQETIGKEADGSTT
ncbi:hypothetical protein GGS20DRAFT_553640 [Poronia punctata]|nr:hypothetical protein GGS20DRAFT_553640 [Poronia punctata]